jgi:hypothetical protein
MSKKCIDTKLGIYNIHMNYDPKNPTLLKDLLNITSVDNRGNSTLMQMSKSFNNHDFPDQEAIVINIQTFKDNQHITGLNMYLDVVAVQFLIDNLQNMVDKMKVKNSNEENAFKKEIINDPI